MGDLFAGPTFLLTAAKISKMTPDRRGFLGSTGAAMANFMEGVKTREQPISYVRSHNATLNVCHAIHIAMRLGRTLTYEPKGRRLIGDDQANTFVSRGPRKGYEIVV